jgi:hypothetical protein
MKDGIFCQVIAKGLFLLMIFDLVLDRNMFQIFTLIRMPPRIFMKY